MPEIKVFCTSCGTAYWVDDQHIGETVDCEECASEFTIMSAASATIAASPTLATGAGTERLHVSRLGMHLVRINSGRFRMGTNHGYASERPELDVQITRPYWLAEFPVTQMAWEQIMGSNPSQFPGSHHPVDSVTWHAAQEFCHRLTEQAASSSELPRGARFRLPTEAEWEFACVTDSTGDQPSGNEDEPFLDWQDGVSSSRVAWLHSHAWFEENSGGKSHEVGMKKPNARGLYDMLGNVGEWCADWYAPYTEGTGATADPRGPTQGSQKVRRGGGCSSVATRCRGTDRFGVPPHTRSACIGFRVALN